MRRTAALVGIVGLVMLVVLIRRLTGGGPGPKTWALCAATIAVLIAAAVMWFRAPAGGEPSAPA